MAKSAYNNQKLTAVEVCVGAGGLALGIARAGFSHGTVVDLYKPACDTLRLNKEKARSVAKDWDVQETDLCEFSFAKFKDKTDLLAGGPPCQPFSYAGKHEGKSDSRNLLPEFIRAVRQCVPRAFVVENVKGLTRESFTAYFDYIKLQLSFPNIKRKHGEKWKEHRARLEKLFTAGNSKTLHYNVVSQVLNATDFGIPQHRQRVFIVGVRADLEIEYSFPVPTHSREMLLWQQWVTHEYWDKHKIAKKLRPTAPPQSVLSRLKVKKKIEPWSTVRDAFVGLPRIAIGRKSHQVTNHFLNPGAREYHGHNGSELDLPAKTIKAGYHGVPGGENMVRLDDGSVRYFSVRECARLQTFPDTWEISGTWTSGMRQLGNAVPVDLAYKVVAPLAKALS